LEVWRVSPPPPVSAGEKSVLRSIQLEEEPLYTKYESLRKLGHEARLLRHMKEKLYPAPETEPGREPEPESEPEPEEEEEGAPPVAKVWKKPSEEWRAWAKLLDEGREVFELVHAKRGQRWMGEMLHALLEAEPRA
jgi:hypothetical protein